MNQANKRRIVLIDHRFQLRMAAAFVGLQVLLTTLFAFGLYLFMDSEIHADLASAHASYQSLSQILLPIVVILAVFSVSLSIMLVTLFVVRISHKVAGPMYRFRTVLEALAQRRIDPMTRIRPDDQLGELAISLDKAVQTVKQDMQDARLEISRARSHLAAGEMSELSDRLDTLELALMRWDGIRENP